MAEIDFDSDPFAIDKCYMLAESVLAQKSSDPYWTQAGRKLLAMVIAYVGNRSIAQHNHLGTVRDLLLSSDLGGLWMALSECENYGGIIRRFGEANLSREEKELASVLETVRTALKFMDSDVMTQFLTASDFVLSDLKSKNITVYIVLPAGTGETYAPWTRLLFNAAFKGAQDLSIAKPKHPILFIMDEFALLGKMERIKQAAGEAAKPKKLKRGDRAIGIDDTDISAIIGKTPQPIFHLDVEEYIGQLGDYDMSEDEKVELLLALWDIVCRFVELGFGVYSDSADGSNEQGKQVKFPRKPKPDVIDYSKK